MSKKVIFILGAILVIALIYFSQSGGESIEGYIQRIEQVRKESEEFMVSSDQSPFKTASEDFQNLKYYPIDPEFKVRAKIEPIETRSFLTLAVSTGEQEKYLKYAYARFELKGQELKLLLLKKATGNRNEPIFTAFADDTSAGETYGGGRYLDLAFKNARTIDLDFNLAYNPYCAYNENYSCPFPPAENVLPVSIEAGEKVYH